MKKLLLGTLSFLSVLSLAACGAEPKEISKEEAQQKLCDAVIETAKKDYIELDFEGDYTVIAKGNVKSFAAANLSVDSSIKGDINGFFSYNSKDDKESIGGRIDIAATLKNVEKLSEGELKDGKYSAYGTVSLINNDSKSKITTTYGAEMPGEKLEEDEFDYEFKAPLGKTYIKDILSSVEASDVKEAFAETGDETWKSVKQMGSSLVLEVTELELTDEELVGIIKDYLEDALTDALPSASSLEIDEYIASISDETLTNFAKKLDKYITTTTDGIIVDFNKDKTLKSITFNAKMVFDCKDLKVFNEDISIIMAEIFGGGSLIGSSTQIQAATVEYISGSMHVEYKENFKLKADYGK